MITPGRSLSSPICIPQGRLDGSPLVNVSPSKQEKQEKQEKQILLVSSMSIFVKKREKKKKHTNNESFYPEFLLVVHQQHLHILNQHVPQNLLPLKRYHLMQVHL